MKSNTANLPITVRQENFGAILYDPAEGTLLELDREGAETITAFFRGHRLKPEDTREKAFLSEVKKEILYSRKRNIRYIQALEPDKHAYPFQVLSAPTLADFQITNRCYMNCAHCYAASSPDGNHTSLEDINLVLSRIKEYGVCQVALGGGEPLLHPHIHEVLRLSHSNGIVPNLSTSGMHLSLKTLRMLKKYCGAVAISMENIGTRLAMWRKTGFENIRQALFALKTFSIPTVIQITLSTDNFCDLDAITDFCLEQKQLYGVIFLAYKPVGRGTAFSQPLSVLDARAVSEKLQAMFLKLSRRTRVGYDCCLAPAIAAPDRKTGFVQASHLEGCSALRGSMGISPELDVIPCTFLPHQVIGNLRQNSLKDIWYGSRAIAFRNAMLNQINHKEPCSACNIRNACLGGCQAMNLVNCSSKSLKSN